MVRAKARRGNSLFNERTQRQCRCVTAIIRDRYLPFCKAVPIGFPLLGAGCQDFSLTAWNREYLLIKCALAIVWGSQRFYFVFRCGTSPNVQLGCIWDWPILLRRKRRWKLLVSLIINKAQPVFSRSSFFSLASGLFLRPSYLLEHIIYMISRGVHPRGTHHTLKLVQHEVHIVAWPGGN